MEEIETLSFDCVIVGAGPAGLSAAIRLAQRQPSLSIAVVEKGAQVGAHILSGAVFNPSVLSELIPDWAQRNAPLRQAVKQETFCYLTQNRRIPLPMLAEQRSKGCYIISLGELCQWLAQEAESRGVHIFPGYAIESPCFDTEQNTVVAVQTRAMGLDQSGQPTAGYQPSIRLAGNHIFIAEGARGSTAEQIIQHFNLRASAQPQHYGIGIKEKWRIQPKNHQPGRVMHTIGWPIPHHTYGGGFVYHADKQELIIGLILALNSKDPRLDPYERLQQFKQHPSIETWLEGGECIAYGARAINEGGYQSIPTCHFPGGSLIGCSAGFVNLAETKGIHHAMRTAMLAADAFIDKEPEQLTRRIKASQTGKALFKSRNLYPAFCWGRVRGLLYAGLDQWLLRGKAPWTFTCPTPDHAQLKQTTPPKLKEHKLSSKTTIPLMSLVALTNTHHREQQPCHLQVTDRALFLTSNWPNYSGPEQYYCPAGVYEYIEVNNQQQFQINSQNCIHCKSCDIRDPNKNITWTVPEGGDGPNYTGM